MKTVTRRFVLVLPGLFLATGEARDGLRKRLLWRHLGINYFPEDFPQSYVE
jgi:hypothetical protein